MSLSTDERIRQNTFESITATTITQTENIGKNHYRCRGCRRTPAPLPDDRRLSTLTPAWITMQGPVKADCVQVSMVSNPGELSRTTVQLSSTGLSNSNIDTAIPVTMVWRGNRNGSYWIWWCPNGQSPDIQLGQPSSVGRIRKFRPTLEGLQPRSHPSQPLNSHWRVFHCCLMCRSWFDGNKLQKLTLRTASARPAFILPARHGVVPKTYSITTVVNSR